MLKQALIALAALALVVLGSGCGGGGSATSTFEEDGFSIVFEHPSDFAEIEDVSIASAAGAASAATEGRGLDERNLILVSRYDLDMSMTQANVSGVKRELDHVLSQAARKELLGMEVEVGGLPGYEYDFDLDSVPPVTSRFLVLFDDRTEYTLNCQWTAERRSEIQAACEQAVATLRTT